jgi:hypothetical protein
MGNVRSTQGSGLPRVAVQEFTFDLFVISSTKIFYSQLTDTNELVAQYMPKA